MSVRARLWVSATVLCVFPLSFLLFLLVPKSHRAAGNGAILVTVIAFTAALAIVVGLVRRFVGMDNFTADEEGLRIESRRLGDRNIPWSELSDLGWVPSGFGGLGGLAGRLKTGGRFEPGGPNIATWLAQPIGRGLPRSDAATLRKLCAEPGVRWTNFAAAEVVTRPRLPEAPDSERSETPSA